VAKFLLFIAVLVVVYVLIRASNRRKGPSPEKGPAEAMAQCAHCGVHFPRAESVTEAEREYCCEDHRRRGVRP
jgi:uncharacterized protein